MGKQQEEGFTGGLSASNAREIRMAACASCWHPAQSRMAVDNLWITMGFIHNRRKRVLRAFGGVLGRAYTYPLPRPRALIVARLRAIPGSPGMAGMAGMADPRAIAG